MTATHAPQRDRSAAVLNKARRQADLNRLREETAKGDIPDLLVIGAGITGVGIALDAASRGLKSCASTATAVLSKSSRNSRHRRGATSC